jgi:hypothetical protein
MRASPAAEASSAAVASDSWSRRCAREILAADSAARPARASVSAILRVSATLPPSRRWKRRSVRQASSPRTIANATPLPVARRNTASEIQARAGTGGS